MKPYSVLFWLLLLLLCPLFLHHQDALKGTVRCGLRRLEEMPITSRGREAAKRCEVCGDLENLRWEGEVGPQVELSNQMVPWEVPDLITIPDTTAPPREGHLVGPSGAFSGWFLVLSCLSPGSGDEEKGRTQTIMCAEQQ